MKNTLLLSGVIMILLSIQSCTVEEEPTTKKEQITIDAQQIENQAVDPAKVKPPTGG